jgi:chromosome segregation ATPase
MPTEQERLTALEQGQDETNRHLTMLLGMARGQEHDIRDMQTEITTIKADISSIKEQLTTVQVELHTGFARMDEQFKAIMALFSQSGKPPTAPEQE